MNLPIDRDFVARLLIVLGVCAGAWLVFVQPRQRELSRLERQLVEATQSSSQTSQEGLEALANKFGAFRQRLQEVNRRNAVAQDTSSLYATIMRLAGNHQVRVQGMQPVPPRDTAVPQAVRAARLEMTLSGDYDNIARFIDAVAKIDAFIRPSSLEVIPLDDDRSRNVSARFGCEVLAFNVDSALASGGDAADAKP